MINDGSRDIEKKLSIFLICGVLLFTSFFPFMGTSGQSILKEKNDSVYLEDQLLLDSFTSRYRGLPLCISTNASRNASVNAVGTLEYEFISVGLNAMDNLGGSMNNFGQIVFISRPISEEGYGDVYLWDNGVLSSITNDSTIDDRVSEINDAGAVVWSWCGGPPEPYWGWPSAEIRVWENGLTRQLTNDELDDLASDINNLGHIVWSKHPREGCDHSSANIYFYDGVSSYKITDDLFSDQGPRINNWDQIVWTKYDNCPPWPDYNSTIWLYTDGNITQISPESPDHRPQVPDIDNTGRVAWYFDVDPETPGTQSGIRVWDDGETMVLPLDNIGGPKLADNGDITFWRWYESTRNYKVWLYHQGHFYQITDDHSGTWSFPDAINNYGDILFETLHIPEYYGELYYARRIPAVGDVNRDWFINGFDVDLFIYALMHTEDQFKAEYPMASYWAADCNQDGVVNSFDIDPFIELLTQG